MNIETLYKLDPIPAVQRLLCCPALDLLAEALSTAGEGWFVALLAIALAWKTNRDRRDALRSALRGMAVIAVTGALVVAIKHIVRAPRPLAVLGPEHVRVLLEPLRGMSFPSGHAAVTAALALWASRELSARARPWPWLFALLCGLSRVYVGAHWATDVVGGWLLGVAAASAVGSAWPRQPRRGRRASQVGPGLAETPALAQDVEGDSCR